MTLRTTCEATLRIKRPSTDIFAVKNIFCSVNVDEGITQAKEIQWQSDVPFGRAFQSAAGNGFVGLSQ
jgi:hypothetical protein